MFVEWKKTKYSIYEIAYRTKDGLKLSDAKIRIVLKKLMGHNSEYKNIYGLDLH